MSDIFKKIGETITGTGKTVGEKTKQAGSVAKLNAKIVSSEHLISENYALIGKYYYNTYKNNPDAEIAEAVNAVTASIESIEEMKNQILAVKGLIKCDKCGAECPFEDKFCGKCGAEIVKPEPVEVEETEAAEEAEEIEIVVVEDAAEEASEENIEE